MEMLTFLAAHEYDLLSLALLILSLSLALTLVAWLGAPNAAWRRALAFYYEEIEERPFRPKPRSIPKNTRRNPNQACTEMAVLQRKIDERRRVVDSSGHSTLYDEYFELVFETRRGEELHLVATRASFKEIPFHQEGALTHSKGVLIKFKYSGGLISDEYTPAKRR